MKTRRNITSVSLIIISLIVGFIIGIMLELPNTNSSNLKGTIGKADKYRNVTITEDDIQLRSEILSDTSLQTGYLNYYTFHYTNIAHLSTIIDTVLASDIILADFNKQNPTIKNGLEIYRKYIETPRSELLLTTLVLTDIKNTEAIAISQILNNANIAIAKISYNEYIITNFIEAANNYIINNKDKELNALMEIHDRFAMVLFSKALVNNNKPMLKYYNKKELYSDTENLKLFYNGSLNSYLIQDTEKLNLVMDQSSLGMIPQSQETLNNIKSSQNLKNMTLSIQQMGNSMNSVFNSNQALEVMPVLTDMIQFNSEQQLNSLWP